MITQKSLTSVIIINRKMQNFTLFPRRILLNSLKSDLRPLCASCVRSLTHSSKEYDGNPDPGPIFIKPEVQCLLKTLTRPDLAKVYKKRKLGDVRLEQPVYKFMTDSELETTLSHIREKVNDILQIPPVLAVRKPIDQILAKEPALQGLETSKFVFTDITFGVRDSDRLIVVRDTDGTLKHADWNVRDRINQLYFPVKHRMIKVPKLFEDQYLEDLLKRNQFEFILDRACLQFEPNDREYQRVVSITYQYLNENNAFESLRSTRHFGGLTFFLAWHKLADNLLLELIETSHIQECNALVELHNQIHKTKLNGLEDYIKRSASKKAALELALQAYKQAEKGAQRVQN